MRFARAICVVLAALLLTGLSSPAWAGTMRDDVDENWYLRLARFYPSVGLIEIETGQGPDPYHYGSGTLVAPDWFLTAAHVVDGAVGLPTVYFETTRGKKVSYQAAEDPILFPGWTGDLAAGNDLALIHLESNVKGIRPAPRYRGDREQGRNMTFVGYGLHGTGLTGFVDPSEWDGKRRAGWNTIDFITAGTEPTVDTLLCDFDNPNDPDDSLFGSSDPLRLEFLPSPGDSGGGAFLGRRLAGVISFGAGTEPSPGPGPAPPFDGDYGDMVGSVRVSEYNWWIDLEIYGEQPTGPGGGGGYKPPWWPGYCDGTDLGLDSMGDYLASIEMTALVLPEPTTLVLLALGAVGLVRRRKR